jgi:hypothetical protein
MKEIEIRMNGKEEHKHASHPYWHLIKRIHGFPADCEFVEFAQCRFVPDGVTETSGKWDQTVDYTGRNLGDPKHPFYGFYGATGYFQLPKGKIICYLDGSQRFLPVGEEENLFRNFTDLTVIYCDWENPIPQRGDLIAYEIAAPPKELGAGSEFFHFGGYDISIANGGAHLFFDKDLKMIYIGKECDLKITHPEYGEIVYEALDRELLGILPGQKEPAAWVIKEKKEKRIGKKIKEVKSSGRKWFIPDKKMEPLMTKRGYSENYNEQYFTIKIGDVEISVTEHNSNPRKDEHRWYTTSTPGGYVGLSRKKGGWHLGTPHFALCQPLIKAMEDLVNSQ